MSFNAMLQCATGDANSFGPLRNMKPLAVVLNHPHRPFTLRLVALLSAARLITHRARCDQAGYLVVRLVIIKMINVKRGPLNDLAAVVTIEWAFTFMIVIDHAMLIDPALILCSHWMVWSMDEHIAL